MRRRQPARRSQRPSRCRSTAPAELYWNNDPVADLPALVKRFDDVAKRTPQPELHLRADRETRYQNIAEVMSAAQKAGIAKIGFVTDPKPSR